MKSRRRRGRNAVTLHEVAKRAGVSPMTASRAISGRTNVSEALRCRVNSAVAELGYSPDPAARSLASSCTLRIGLLYGNPSATFTHEFLVELLESSARVGCQLVLEKCAAPRGAPATARKLIGRGIDGVLLPTPLCDSTALMRQFEAAGIPCVAVGTGREDVRGLAVRIDNVRAAAEMTRYLLSLGHRNIGFILGHPQQIDSDQRYEGFASALKLAGLAVRSKWVKQGQYTYRSGWLAAESLLKGKDRPTAIFASNDDMAAGALAMAHRLKLDVPRDVSIVGFDDTPLATTIWPALTTIRQPVGELIQQALALAVEDIRRRRAGQPLPGRQKIVRLALVKRESAAAPPART